MSQSRYPLKTVIDNDSVVILTKGQADTINQIFESQKRKIQESRLILHQKDSLIRRKDSLLRLNKLTTYDYDSLHNEYITTLMFLDYLESWVFERAVEGAWLYYSQDCLQIEAVDLSPYSFSFNEQSGNLIFFRDEDSQSDDKKNKAPKRGWEKEVILTKRPKVKRL